MSDLREKILKSPLVTGGEAFCASDIVGRCKGSSAETKAILEDLVRERFLISDIRSDKRIYCKRTVGHPLLNRPLANYMPPRPAGKEHMNPWVRI